jgi:hypothetical protein
MCNPLSYKATLIKDHLSYKATLIKGHLSYKVTLIKGIREVAFDERPYKRDGL